MFRDPRREDHTIWTASPPTRSSPCGRTPPHETTSRRLVRKFPGVHWRTCRLKRYDQADPATVIKVRGYVAACVALAAQGADKRDDELPLLPAVEPRPLIRPYVGRAPLTWRYQGRVLRCSGERDRPRHFTGSVVERTRAIGREFLDAVGFPSVHHQQKSVCSTVPPGDCSSPQTITSSTLRW